jgi:AmmeMemoRadiSam system protein B
VEFQAVHLRYLFGDDVPPMVPVLSGSLERVVSATEDPAAERTVSAFMGALHTVARDLGRRVCVIAGADLAHLGPRFDDPDPLTDPALAGLAERDGETLSAIAAGDARAFFRSVMQDGNARRICGLAPIYLALSWAKGCPATVTHYRQWVEEGSVVTFAAADIHG